MGILFSVKLLHVIQGLTLTLTYSPCQEERGRMVEYMNDHTWTSIKAKCDLLLPYRLSPSQGANIIQNRKS